jgi:hypothetical protein
VKIYDTIFIISASNGKEILGIFTILDRKYNLTGSLKACPTI